MAANNKEKEMTVHRRLKELYETTTCADTKKKLGDIIIQVIGINTAFDILSAALFKITPDSVEDAINRMKKLKIKIHETNLRLYTPDTPEVPDEETGLLPTTQMFLDAVAGIIVEEVFKPEKVEKND